MLGGGGRRVCVRCACVRCEHLGHMAQEETNWIQTTLTNNFNTFLLQKNVPLSDSYSGRKKLNNTQAQ